MSTRTRDSAPAKEKRGTSPSHTATAPTQRSRRSPNPSKTNSPARSPDSTTAPSGKNIPNYLKPTLSSANDTSKQQGKKPATSTADSKPNLARRRSFDKPPSPSPTQVSRVSPKPTLRSSSFSGRSSANSQKGVPDRNLKGPKEAGKQHTLYARPVYTVKKSSGLAKKPEPGSGSSRKERVSRSPGKADNPNIVHDVPQPEPQSDDQLVESYNEKGSEDSMMEHQEVVNTIEESEGESHDKDAEIVTAESPAVLEQHDANIVVVESPAITENEDEKIVTVEPSTVLENQDASVGVNTEELEDESRVDETKEHISDEMNDTNTDESVAGNFDAEVEEKATEQEEEESEEETAAELNKKEEEESGDESHESKEKEAVEEEKNEDENAAQKVAHGKKDVALSNNVIEETASKLREQRKNKVKALAGAFETVISLQEPK